MRGSLTIDEFARLTHIPVEEIERYREAGLLDTDGDGRYDEYDVLRLRFLKVMAADQPPEEAARRIDELADQNRWGDVLYGSAGDRVSIEEAAERTGLTTEQIRALQVATGLPESMLDVQNLSTTKQLLDAGIPWEAVIEGTRVLGDSIRRIADTEVKLFHAHVHERLVKEGVPEEELVKIVQEAGDAALPLMDQVLLFLHHGHLLRASAEDAIVHLEGSAPPETPGATAVTILFVDIALFTSLAQAHGDEAAMEVVERFDSMVRSLALQHDGTLVKQIGDEFMLAFKDPVDAARFAVALDEAATGEPEFPSLRAGINHGPVLFRMGDYFGNTVNLAARVVAMAMAGEILVTEPVASAAEAAGIPIERLGVRVARGVQDPVAVARIVRARPLAERDPVCGMTVNADAPAQLVHEGRRLYFCSQDCLQKFIEAPGRYTAAPA